MATLEKNLLHIFNCIINVTESVKLIIDKNSSNLNQKEIYIFMKGTELNNL